MIKELSILKICELKKFLFKKVRNITKYDVMTKQE